MSNPILNGLSVLREREGYIVTCNKLHGDTYQVVYVNLKNGKTKVTNGTEDLCSEILKEYGVIVNTNDRHDEDKNNYAIQECDEAINVIPNELAISIRQGDREISRARKK